MGMLVAFLLYPAVFWIIATLSILVFFYDVSNDKNAYSVLPLSVLITLAILKWSSFSAILSFIANNPVIIISGIGLYFVLGTLWATFKWYLYVKKEANEINDFINSKASKEIAADEMSKRSYYGISKERLLETNFMAAAPQASKHKGKITSWIAFWVPSAIWSLINDPIRKIVNGIYDSIKGIFQNISNSIFKSAIK